MEYAADHFAATLSRPGPTPSELSAAAEFNAEESNAAAKVDPNQKEEYVDLLGKALIKLHVHNLSTMHHDPLFSAYHYSHPTLAERLNALQALRPTLKKRA